MRWARVGTAVDRTDEASSLPRARRDAPDALLVWEQGHATHAHAAPGREARPTTAYADSAPLHVQARRAARRAAQLGGARRAADFTALVENVRR
eukprot:6177083-Pleurochrysis_carterae.AAC.5